MKKRLLVIATVLMIMGNALFVSASENLDRFSEAIKGTWNKKTEMQNSGYEHSGLFKDTITLPNPSYILTEDSTGLVYITALEYGSSVSTMGVLWCLQSRCCLQIFPTL